MKYSVYEIEPQLGCYRGLSLVAAKSAEEANVIIKDFIKNNERKSIPIKWFRENEKAILMDDLDILKYLDKEFNI